MPRRALAPARPFPYEGPIADGHLHTAGAYADSRALLWALDRGAMGRSVRRVVAIASPVLGDGARRVPWAYQRTVGTWRLGKHLSWRFLGSRFAARIRCQSDNAVVARLVAAAPDRVAGFAFVDPTRPEPEGEAQHWVDGAGFSGLKLHGWFHRASLASEGVARLAAFAAQRRLPILVHPAFGGSCERDLDRLARHFSDVPFIVAHLDRAALPVAARHDNIFLDTSGLTITPAHLAHALKTVGASKLIFGSDAPSETGGDLGYSLHLLARAGLPIRDLERICWSNLQALLPPAPTGVSHPTRQSVLVS